MFESRKDIKNKVQIQENNMCECKMLYINLFDMSK